MGDTCPVAPVPFRHSTPDLDAGGTTRQIKHAAAPKDNYSRDRRRGLCPRGSRSRFPSRTARTGWHRSRRTPEPITRTRTKASRRFVRKHGLVVPGAGVRGERRLFRRKWRRVRVCGGEDERAWKEGGVDKVVSYWFSCVYSWGCRISGYEQVGPRVPTKQ